MRKLPTTVKGSDKRLRELDREEARLLKKIEQTKNEKYRVFQHGRKIYLKEERAEKRKRR